MSTLMNRFRAEVAKSKDYNLKVETEATVGYSTGFLNFDFLNGTVVHVKSEERTFNYYSIGIPDGCMVMIIGRSGCGKTTWAMQAAANIIRPFKNASIFHDDIEGGITEYRKELLTNFHDEEYKSRILSRNTGITAENFYARIKMIHGLKTDGKGREEYEYDTGCFDSNGNRIFKLAPTVYLLDSVALLMPEKYTDEEELSGSMSATAAAKANSMIFKRVVPMLKSANIILMMINHITTKIDINPMAKTKSQVGYLKQGEELPGGRTIVYLASILLRFDDNTKLKEEETFGIAGNMVDLTIVKSRNNRAGQSCTLVFDQARGFDPELSLFVMLKNAKRINGAGAYLYIGDRSDIKFSQKQFKPMLAENVELRNIFIQECLNILKENLDKSDTFEEISGQDYNIMNDIVSQLNPNVA